MPFSWIYLLFICTATAAVGFAAWSLLRTKKSYERQTKRNPLEAKKLREKVDHG